MGLMDNKWTAAGVAAVSKTKEKEQKSSSNSRTNTGVMDDKWTAENVSKASTAYKKANTVSTSTTKSNSTTNKTAKSEEERRQNAIKDYATKRNAKIWGKDKIADDYINEVTEFATKEDVDKEIERLKKLKESAVSEYADSKFIDRLLGGVQTPQEQWAKYDKRIEELEQKKVEIDYYNELNTYLNYMNNSNFAKASADGKKRYKMPKLPNYTVTEDAENLYYYVAERQGKEKADEFLVKYAEYFDKQAKSNLNQKISEKIVEPFAKKVPVLSDIASVPMSVAGGAAAYADTMQQMLDYYLTGRHQPVNLNAGGYGALNMADTIRNTRKNQIADKFDGNTDSFGYKTSEFGYDTLMSMADSASTLALGPIGAPAAMAAYAGGRTSKDTLEKGKSFVKAAENATASAVVEAAIEKVGFDRLKGFMTNPALKNVFGGMIAEGLEEGATEVINTLTDNAIMGTDSNYNELVQSYISAGYTKEKAKRAALLDIAKQVGLATAGGAISGGVFGGVATAAGYRSSSKLGEGIANDEQVDLVIEAGLDKDPDSPVYKLAERLDKKIKEGKKVSTYEIGELSKAIMEYGMEQESDDIQYGLRISEEEKLPDVGYKTAENNANVQKINNVKDGNVYVDIEQDGKTSTVKTSDLIFNNEKAQAVYEMAAEFDTNGAKAFWSSYSGEIPLNNYYKAFRDSYDAGNVGLDINTIPEMSKMTLPKEIQMKAWFAGQNDAKAVATKGTFAKDAGIVWNEQAQKMDKNLLFSVEQLSQAAGVKVVFDESLIGTEANGYYSDGQIHISPDADSPVMTIFKHELTHHLQSVAPQAYNQYRNFVLEYFQKDSQFFEERMNANIEAYQRIGQMITRGAAMDEIVADATELFLTDGRAARDLARENPSIAKRFIEWIHEIIDKISEFIKTGSFTNAESAKLSEDIETLRKAEKMWLSALDEASTKNDSSWKNAVNNAKAGNSEIQEEVRFSIKKIKNGFQYVEIENEIVKNVPREKRPKFIQNYMLQRYRNKVIGTKNTALFTRTSSEEYAHPHKKLRQTKLAAKYNAATELENLMDASTWLRHEDSYENKHKDAVGGWEKYGVVFKAGSEYYSGEISIMNRENDRMFFDITKIKNITSVFQQYITSADMGKSQLESDIFKTSISLHGDEVNKKGTSQESNAKALNTTPETHLAAVLDNSISLENDNNNKKFSLTNKDSKGRLLTEQQQDYFKDSKIKDENGNLMVMYHGTPIGGHTTFRSGTYFTPDSDYANNYQDPSASSLSIKKTKDNPMTYEVYLNITKPFDTRNAKERRIFQNEYYRKYGTGAPLMESGLPDWTDGLDLQEFIEEMEYDYDGLILDEGGVPDGHGGVIKRGLSYVVFDSYQVKNVDNTSPTKDKDIRFSLKSSQEASYKNLVANNEYLRSLNAELQGQLKELKGRVPDNQVLNESAAHILKKYQSSYGRKNLVDTLYNMIDHISKNNVKAEDIHGYMTNLAKDILSESKTVDRTLADQYKDLRNKIRKTAIRLSTQDRPDIGDYESFRKSNFGRLRLVNEGGILVNELFEELATEHPDVFNAGETTHPADQLMALAEFMEETAPVYTNKYHMDMDASSSVLAHELFNEYFKRINKDAPAGENLISSAYESKLERLKKSYKNKYDERITEMRRLYRDSEEKKINKLKEYYHERLDKQRETMKDRRLAQTSKAKIIKDVKEMTAWLSNPTDAKHVPQSLQSTLADFLMQIDFSSNRLNEYGLKTKNTKIWEEMQLKLREIIDGNSGDSDQFMEIDPELPDKLQQLADGIRDTDKLSDLNGNQLEELSQIVAAMKKMIRDADKLLANKRYENIYRMKETFYEEFDGKKPKKQRIGLGKLADKHLNVDMLDSRSYFKQLGSVGESLYEEIRLGFDKKIRNTKIASDYMKDLLKNADISKWTGKKALSKTFTTSFGETIELTPAQVMSLYCLSKRDQAKGHMYSKKGGITPSPEIHTITETKTIKGKTITKKRTGIKKAYDPVRILEDDVEAIIDTLTPEQKRIADGIMSFFTSHTSAWGNEVSMEMYGYEKFKEKNYFPIVSDKNYIPTRDGDIFNEESTLKNLGMTKATKAGANNAIIIEDIFDVFTRQADQMSSYNAFVVPLSDLQKFYNAKDPGFTSVKGYLDKYFGDAGKKYIHQLLVDINGSARQGVATDISNKLLSNMKAASVGANLRVIAQQPTAYLRAAAMIDPKYLTMGLAKKGNFNLVKKYAPIAQWKDWGFFEMDTGRQMKQIFMGVQGIDRLKELSMAGAGAADNITWSRLWNAVEFETRAKHKNLEYGSDEFYKKVAERFSDIVDATQVVDSVLHRSQIMRSDNTAVKMATSFMAEPTKSYNMLWTALVEMVKEKTPEKRKQFARSVTAFVITAIATSAAAGVIDIFRDKDEDETLKEKFEQALLSNMVDNLNPLNLIPYAKDFVSLVKGYDVARTDMAGIADVVNSAKKWMQYFEGASKYTVNYLIQDTAGSLSKVFGIPIKNTMRTLTNLKDAIINQFGSDRAKYKNKALDLSVKAEYNYSDYMDKLLDARFSGNDELAIEIANDLVKTFGSEKVMNSIESGSVKRLSESEDIKDLYYAMKSFDLTTYDNIRERLLKEGFTTNTISKALNKYQKSLEGDDEELDYTNIESDYFAPVQETDEDNMLYGYDLLYEAKRVGNKDAYDKVYEALIAQGKSESSIASGLLGAYNRYAEENGLQVYTYEALLEAKIQNNSKKYWEIVEGMKSYGKKESSIMNTIRSKYNEYASESGLTLITFESLYEYYKPGSSKQSEKFYKIYDELLEYGIKEDTIQTELNTLRNTELKETDPLFKQCADARRKANQTDSDEDWDKYNALRDRIVEKYEKEGYTTQRVASIISSMLYKTKE